MWSCEQTSMFRKITNATDTQSHKTIAVMSHGLLYVSDHRQISSVFIEFDVGFPTQRQNFKMFWRQHTNAETNISNIRASCPMLRSHNLNQCRMFIISLRHHSVYLNVPTSKWIYLKTKKKLSPSITVKVNSKHVRFTSQWSSSEWHTKMISSI